MTTKTDELAREVRRSLRDQADGVVVDDRPFDPERSGLALDPEIDGARRPRRPVAWVAVAAVVCLIAGLVAVAVRHDDGSKVDSVAPPASTTVPWFLPTGTEKPMPSFPDGWQVLDYGDVRFAVPAGWTVLAPDTCPQVDDRVVGYVLVRSPGDPTPFCPAMIGPSPPTVRVSADAPSLKLPTGGHRTVGTFSAVAESAECGPGCTTDLRLETNDVVSVTGPDAERILATFTDSGRVRVLQAGPTVDRSGWHTVSYAGVSLEVPPDWDTVDLAGAVTRTTAPDGTPTGVMATHLDPASCGSGYFRSGAQPTVFTGTTGIFPSCPYSGLAQLDPADGVWIRGPGDDITALPKTPATGPPSQDLRVVMSTTPAQPAIVLDGQYRGTYATVIVGVGLDPAVARTILQTLHVT